VTGPGAVPLESSATGGKGGVTVFLMRDVPVGSRRGRVSLAIGIQSPKQSS
jgi:hypothetical protein